jgi:AraC-like DNA-binding protein
MPATAPDGVGAVDEAAWQDRDMQGAPKQFESQPFEPHPFEYPQDVAQFRRPAHRPGIELYRAHIVRHAFDPHTHEAYGLGAIEAGAERFRYRGSEHIAPPDSLVQMNPDVLHTGRAETEGGWRYRMAYIDTDVVEALTGERGWWFDEAVRHDRPCAQRVTRLLDALWLEQEPLAFDSLLASLLMEFGRNARAASRPMTSAAPRFAPVIEYLRANLAERLTLDDVATVAGLSPFHFLRSFQAQYHATPQQMLMALRLYEAKRRLAAGEAPAQVAVAVGLSDQAHLNRTFQRRYGVTPARYRRQMG